MKKYKFITDIHTRKIVVDDLDNNRATIYWHNGRIEKMLIIDMQQMNIKTHGLIA